MAPREAFSGCSNAAMILRASATSSVGGVKIALQAAVASGALPVAERNALLAGAGFAGIYQSTPLDSVAMAPVSRAIEFLLAQQEPYAALLIDRCWNVLRVNDGARRLLGSFLDPSKVPSAVAQNLVRAANRPVDGS